MSLEHLRSQATLTLSGLFFMYYTAWTLGLPLIKDFPYSWVFPDPLYAVIVPIIVTLVLCLSALSYICVIMKWKP